MKVIIIGAVAAGTTAAAKLRRNAKDAVITVYERDQDISYGICGIPYYIGGEIEKLEALTPRKPEWFKDRYDVNIFIRHEVTDIDPIKKTVTVLNLKTQEEKIDSYDVLILATGASPVLPEIKGIHLNGIFPVRTIQDTKKISDYIHEKKPEKAVVVGSGYIGLEMAEQLNRRGMEITVIQRSGRVMSILDQEVTDRIEKHLAEKNVKVILKETVTQISKATGSSFIVHTDKGSNFTADLVIMAAGIRPNTKLAERAGLRMGKTGAVAVNEKMQTSNPDIYAVGDVVESFSKLTGEPIYRPLGSTANKMGRIAADAITGGELRHRGILGTSIVRVFDLEVAQTGLTEKEARTAGLEVQVAELKQISKPAYMQGEKMLIKAISDSKDGRLLGVQIIGGEGVDKRIDVLATAIFFGAKVEDLFHLDLAYAPPFSPPKDPVHYIGMVLSKEEK